jgi:hypothetical protein
MSQDREQLRAKRNLRIVTDAEAGSAIDTLPGGIYGFTYSPSTEGVPLFAKQTYQIFEVHKTADDTPHFIGYMTPAEAKALETGGGADSVDLKLYPEPYEQATTFVSVPRERILKVKPVSRENGNFFPMTVLPPLPE